MEICSENDDLDGDVSNFVMMHAEIKRNDDPFLRFLNRDISEKHLRYTDLDSDFKVLTQKMLPELAKLFGYITVHKQRVVSRALLKTIVEMLGSLEREMLVSSMTDFFYQVLGSVTWHAGQSDLESISSESSEELPMSMRFGGPAASSNRSLKPSDSSRHTTSMSGCRPTSCITTPPRQLGGGPPHPRSPPSPKSLSGSKKGRAANPLRSPLCTPAVPAPSGTRLHINRRRPPPRPPRFLTQWSPSRLRAPAPQPQPRRRG
ncbi:hypothetical protein PAPYR_11684 [Paratrimastix pyriformis]|uniref:Uncharacterized protein n=1 Tax=Paratrimastix pyriformis TaxID=342808 RepID=A0ABQ8U841_9EUKA|nr:hypothetical protein PAPYR_11684 [Paratrimastix pyriformis]